MWWCCGAGSENAIGCIANKHVPREDDEEEDELEEKEREEKEKEMYSNTKCFSCRDVGHKSTDCLKDPNFRSFYDMESELVRIVRNNKKHVKEE
jgi:hypothetical protein